MEFVALSDTVLRTLAMEDRELRRVFQGVFPADQLPRHPFHTTRAAYIVNTYPAGEPGQHWLALWTEKNECEVFDSYGLPLHVYTNPDLHAWWAQWKYLTRSDQTIQALDSQTCGHYVLMFLKAKARGCTFQEFLSRWNSYNLVINDRRVAQDLKRLIKEELYDTLNGSPSRGQSSVSRCAFCAIQCVE